MATKKTRKTGAAKAAPLSELQGFSAAQRKELEETFARERDNAPGEYRRSSATKFVNSLERIAWIFESMNEIDQPRTAKQQRDKQNAAKAALRRAADHLRCYDENERIGLFGAIWSRDYKTARARFGALGIGPGQGRVMRDSLYSYAESESAFARALLLLDELVAAIPQATVISYYNGAGYDSENSVAADIVEVFAHFGLHATSSANGFAVHCYKAIADLARVQIKSNTARSRMEWAVNYAEPIAKRMSRPQGILVSRVGNTDSKKK